MSNVSAVKQIEAVAPHLKFYKIASVVETFAGLVNAGAEMTTERTAKLVESAYAMEAVSPSEMDRITEILLAQPIVQMERDGSGKWVARLAGKAVGHDKYQNDLKPRLESQGYVVVKVGD